MSEPERFILFSNEIIYANHVTLLHSLNKVTLLVQYFYRSLHSYQRVLYKFHFVQTCLFNLSASI